MSRTLVWLALESIIIPRVSGRFDSAVKYLMVCGLPSSAIEKSSLVRLGIRAPCLSFTLKKSWTILAFALNVATGPCDSCEFWSFCGDVCFCPCVDCWLGEDWDPCWPQRNWLLSMAAAHTPANTHAGAT